LVPYFFKVFPLSFLSHKRRTKSAKKRSELLDDAASKRLPWRVGVTLFIFVSCRDTIQIPLFQLFELDNQDGYFSVATPVLLI